MLWGKVVLLEEGEKKKAPDQAPLQQCAPGLGNPASCDTPGVSMAWGSGPQLALIPQGVDGLAFGYPAGCDPPGMLMADLCRAMHYFAYGCAGALGTGCRKGIKKLPDKLIFFLL